MKRLWLAVAALAVGVGCAKGVTVTQVAPGAVCADGGVTLTEPGLPAQTICNGISAVLSEAIQLPVGDPNCPQGGVAIQSGLDNGAGGGVANDGKLEAGEVTNTQYLCDGATNGVITAPLTPPPGPVGSFTVRINGGNGTTGTGGVGGSLLVSQGDPFSIPATTGNVGGHVRVFSTGGVDAGFTFPPAPAGDFGTQPATFTSSSETTVQIPAETVTSPPPVTEGNYFTYGGYLYVVSGGISVVVTGLNVGANVTVVFALPAGASGIALNFSSSCHNAGTLTVPSYTSAQMGSLQLKCGDYYGAPGSSVLTAGSNGTGGSAGMSGGALAILISSGDGSLWNQGTLTANGGDGAGGGGNGGNITLTSNEITFNTGALSSHGGQGLGTTAGGIGGAIQAENYNGAFYNSGVIDGSGGAGGSAGGNGGSLKLWGGYAYDGDLISSGDVRFFGGSVASGCSGTCLGGNGGTLDIEAAAGQVIVTGQLLAYGGASPAGAGGLGGNIRVFNAVQYAWWGNYIVPLGDVVVANNVDASGASGVSGGTGGSVAILSDPNHYNHYGPVSGGQVTLYGVSELHAEGGNGASGGGAGGPVYLVNAKAVDAMGNVYAGGSVLNYANIFTQGGSATTSGSAGHGGPVTISTDGQVNMPNESTEVVVNAGNIQSGGGSGPSGGATGGVVQVVAIQGVTQTGTLTTKGGGVASGGSGNGGAGGEVQVVTGAGPIAFSGSADVSGGASAGATSLGGNASGVLLFAQGGGVSLSGGLQANGGAGGASAGGVGGAAGNVTVFSVAGTPTKLGSSAAISVVPGTGAKAGATGQVQIDGQLVTSAWSH
jgi:hypothetical protein